MSSAPPRPAARPPGQRPSAPSATTPASKLNVAIDPIKLLRQNWIWLALSGFLGIGLGIAAYFALLYFTPIYTAKAYFEVAGLISDSDEITSSIGTSEDEIDRYIQSQVARMVSDDILRDAANDPVIRQDASKWSAKFQSSSGSFDPVEAYLALKDIVQVRAVPDTNYIVLSVSAGSKADAETIGRVVSNKYRDQLNQDRTRGQLDIEQSLTNQLNAIQEERLLLEDRMRRLLRDNNLTTLDEKLTTERIVIESTLPVLQETRYNLSNLREQLSINEEQLRAPGGANYPEIIRSTVSQDPVIVTFVRRLADLRASLRAARESYGPNHRTVKQLQTTISTTEDEMESQEQTLLAEKFNEYIGSLNVQIRTMETIEAESVDRLEAAQTRQSELQAILEDYNTLGEDLDRLAGRETELEARISEARALQSRRDSSRVQMIQSPKAEEAPTFPKIIIIVPVVTVLVTGFVGGLIFLRELLEQRVRGPADLTLIPRLRIAGVVPDLSEDPSKPPAVETAVLDRPRGVVSEAIRSARIELLKRFGASGYKTLLVASGMPRSGATSVAMNLGYSLASCELRTLIIDANLRRPGVHAAAGVDESPGLAEILAFGKSLSETVKSTSMSGLDVLTAGSFDARQPELLITKRFSDLLAAAKDAYDIIIIDAPPAIVSSDALNIAAKCDASVLVIRAYAEKRGLVTRLRNRLEESGADFLGVLLNGVRSSAGGYFRSNYLESHRYSAGDPGAAAEPKPTKPTKPKKSKKPKKPRRSADAPPADTDEDTPERYDDTL